MTTNYKKLFGLALIIFFGASFAVIFYKSSVGNAIYVENYLSENSISASSSGNVESSLQFVSDRATSSVQVKPKGVSVPRSGQPAHLRIDAAGIDAPIEIVGNDPRGDIGIPSTFHTVAWYDKSAFPGTAGSAIISGHLDNGLGFAGVFKKLNSVKKGDPIFIVWGDGRAIRYEVETVSDVPYKKGTESLLSGRLPRLVLITCGGSWMPKERTYNERLVVTAVLQKY